jgi:hypothetical protein
LAPRSKAPEKQRLEKQLKRRLMNPAQEGSTGTVEFVRVL